MIFLKRFNHFISFIKNDSCIGVNAYYQVATVIICEYSINLIKIAKTYYLKEYLHNINIITLRDLFVINQFELNDVCCRHIRHTAYNIERVRKIKSDITFSYTDDIPSCNRTISEVNVCIMDKSIYNGQSYNNIYDVNSAFELKNYLIITNINRALSRNSLRKYIKYHKKREIDIDCKMRIYVKGKYRMTI